MTRPTLAPILPFATEPTKADHTLGRLAASAIYAARRRDRNAIDLILDRLERWQVAKLVTILACAADSDEVLHAAGLTDDDSKLRRLRREYERLRKAGLTVDEMPPHVVEGNRAYHRVAGRRKRQAAKVA